MRQKDKELFEAVRMGQPELARAAIDAGANGNARDQWQKTPLHWAAADGRTDTARVLIGAGADVNARDEFQETPLHIVARNGHTDTARLLIQHGADINARNERQTTPRDCVVDAPDMVALLEAAARERPKLAALVTRRRGDDPDLSR